MSSKIEQLREKHELYRKAGKFIWIFSAFALLLGAMQIASSLYKYGPDAEIRAASAYGIALSGDLNSYSSGDNQGPPIKGGNCLAIGVAGLAGAYYLRRQSKEFSQLPDEVRLVADSTYQNPTHGSAAPTTEVEQLSKLHELLRAGALTESEYTKAKLKLIG